MVVPEINPEHFEVIEFQKKRLGTTRGFVAVKPNCSIQSYAPVLTAWKEFEPYEVVATTYQAISGAGKTFKDWPEMVGNIIPYIGGEEEKSEQEPLRLWGKIEDGVIVKAAEPSDYLPVHPCTGTERTYRSRICKIQKETDQGGADRPAGEFQRSSAGAGASERTEAVHSVSGRG